MKKLFIGVNTQIFFWKKEKTHHQGVDRGMVHPLLKSQSLQPLPKKQQTTKLNMFEWD
jgi:hypothetical protein